MIDTPAASGGICYGAKAIAAHLGVTPRQARHLVESGHVPVFYTNSTMCITRAQLDQWIADRSASAATRSRTQAPSE